MTDAGMLPPDPLRDFFFPRGIVVIGVSRDPTRLGYGLARNIVRRSSAPVYLVHPVGGEWEGHTLHRTVSEVPRPVDLALLLLPAAKVADALRESAQAGVRAAIVQSGGFRESGEAGERLEAELAALAREWGVRLIGPNCIGVVDTHLPLDTTFLPPRDDRAGTMAFVSHSGATCSAMLDRALLEGWGFSRVISLGNQADVGEAEALLSLAHDPHTRAIALYLEGIQDGERFLAAARAVTPIKPIVALKVGRSAEGQRAARSHTGALASSDRAVEAAFAHCGILRAHTVEEMIALARGLAHLKPSAGPRVTILTNAGGPGVMAADLLGENGLELAEISAGMRAQLADRLPPAAALDNPVDMLASAGAVEHAQCARLLLEEAGTDALIVTIVPPPMHDVVAVAEALSPVLRTAVKPAAVCIMGGASAANARERLREAGVMECAYPSEAVLAISAAWHRALVQSPRGESLAERLSITAGLAQEEFTHLSTEKPEAIAAFNLAQAIGLHCPAWKLAADEAQAADAAAHVGWPVALKAVAQKVMHKSEAGGVALGLANEGEVREAYRHMRLEVEAYAGKGAWQGALVQAMAPAGQEVIVGAVRDAQFGPLLMFGSGGREVEGMGDVAFALAPLTLAEAQAMLLRTWAGRRLGAVRGARVANREAVLDALAAIEGLMLAHPGLLEFEVNPLIVTAHEAWAVDVRGTIEEGSGHR
jgi:acetyltransferase